MTNEITTPSEPRNKLEGFLLDYSTNPSLRGLCQVASAFSLGIVGGADAALATQITNIQKERFKTFFDELANGEFQLNEEMIQKEEFLHAYFATLKATQNTRERGKIKLFGKLFTNFSEDNDLQKIDDYEDFLALLTELSYREFQLLLLLKAGVTQPVVELIAA